MFISLTNILIPADSGQIDPDQIMAQVDAIVPSRTDVVAVSSFDGSACVATAKDAASLQSAMTQVVTGLVDGSAQKMALWSFQVSQANNYFLFYRLL